MGRYSRRWKGKMKVVLLNKNNTVYTSNAYLVLGNWNRLEDINTLIDVADGSIISEIEKCSFRKSGKIRLIRLSSHTIILIIQKSCSYQETIQHKSICIFAQSDFVDELLKDGQMISIADMVFPGYPHPEPFK